MSRERERRAVDPRPSGRPGGAAPATPATLALQRAAGNRAVNALLGRRTLARDGYQLQLPQIGSSAGWRGRRPTLGTPRLHLDPQIAAQARAALGRSLRAPSLADQIFRLPNSAFIAPRGLPPGALTPDPEPRLEAPDPSMPPGFEEPTRGASIGMLVGAILRTPQGARAVENLRRDALHGLTSGQRSALGWIGLGFGLSTLGGVLATPGGRELIGQLSGRVIPVPIPQIPGLSMEFTSIEPHIGFGLHLDLGRYLPARYGFGPASPAEPPTPLYGGDD